MRHLIRSALFAYAILIGLVSSASAVTFTYSTSDPYAGSVTGILGMSVDDQLYDVKFLYGSYEDIYPNNLTFANATSIMDAINYQLNSPSTKAIAKPVDVPMNYKLPATLVGSTEVSHYGARVDIFSGLWVRQLTPPGPFTISITQEVMWAQVTPVPLPAGVWLLLSALGGLGLAGWRRKRLATA